MTSTTYTADHLPKAGCMTIDPPTDIQQRGGLGADNHYDLLPMERIRELPVPDLLADNALVFLWSTNAAMPDSFKLAQHWGLRYVGLLTWGKSRLGLGRFVRNSTEQVLVLTKGRPPVSFRSQQSLVLAPVQAHSQKPEEFFSVFERMAPIGPHIELFARRRPPTKTPWLVWGNEIESDFEIPGWPVPAYSASARRIPRADEAEAA